MSATATCDRGYILDHVVPAVPELTEGSMWDLTNPDATIVLTSNGHKALLPIHLGQRVTILGPPIWLWNSMEMAFGERAVPATGHNQYNNNYNSDHALLGLASLERPLTSTNQCPILL